MRGHTSAIDLKILEQWGLPAYGLVTAAAIDLMGWLDSQIELAVKVAPQLISCGFALSMNDPPVAAIAAP